MKSQVSASGACRYSSLAYVLMALHVVHVSNCTPASASGGTPFWPVCSSPFTLYLSSPALLRQLLGVLLFDLCAHCPSRCTCFQLHSCISFWKYLSLACVLIALHVVHVSNCRPVA